MIPNQASHSNTGLLGVKTLLISLLLAPCVCQAGTYDNQKSIFDTLLDSANYNPMQRPLRDQKNVLHVSVMFELISIVEINDVIQSFKCNGFFGLVWQDEILQWNSSDYGGQSSIAPKVTSVFLPQMILLNTLGDRDIFEDANAPLYVSSNGSVQWVPGGIFPTSCRLDLTKFPFDEQHCEIQMISMNYDVSEILFVAEESGIGRVFYTPNGLWDITNASLTTPNITVRWRTVTSILVSFDLKRKPAFLILSTMLPVVFLSLLNLLVFFIPVDSGEKISYGITVLLALALFLSIMSEMLPSSSESLPLIMYYIFILLAISVLSVVDSIIISWLHQKEEKGDTSQKAAVKVQPMMPRIRALKTAAAPFQTPSGPTPMNKNMTSHRERPFHKDLPHDIKGSGHLLASAMGSKGFINVNKYKQIGVYLNWISLVSFGLVWISVNIGFISYIMN
ncbi:neuronal acetylcholine receptor subunit alpha-3 [Elysia marginata]|uniref:Neuronal acetylcholine receptor subunit alpha-3 n=1 Tax=Elysia marginata TaxID=1093978 RepID=A0AAV4JIF1_9GAST|nr:neuronal acetylcholine receptor subunit alpha-3 [Elysia marginata]